jgi:hypothetical protein
MLMGTAHNTSLSHPDAAPSPIRPTSSSAFMLVGQSATHSATMAFFSGLHLGLCILRHYHTTYRCLLFCIFCIFCMLCMLSPACRICRICTWHYYFT